MIERREAPDPGRLVPEAAPWTFRGRVVEGRRLGRLLGVPTANLVPTECDPASWGSWAATATVRGRRLPAIVHVGVRPSIGGDAPVVEVHLLDFSGDLYGEELAVRLLRKVSEEVRARSIEELRTKIRDDVERVRRFFRRGARAARIRRDG